MHIYINILEFTCLGLGMATNRMKGVDFSVQSTSSVLAALDSDNSDVEVLSAVSESDHEYNDISKTDS